jgi:glyoxylase-like metal-dependent hydrolase (beta-lactamase superfamily II)
MDVMTQPTVGGFKDISVPCYSFLIHNKSLDRRIVFDLGIRKDFENSPAPLVKTLKEHGFKIDVEHNVVDVLSGGGVDLKGIEAVIWSHYHLDHTGDPSTFPKSTKLIAGPGVFERFQVGWPTDEKAVLDEKAWEGRERIEWEFEDGKGLKIGRFRATDYFGDGSFYLLDTPGHLLGHMCGLARTTEDTFILMGGDAAHHAGEFRPTEYIPLPDSIELYEPPKGFPCPCPGELIMQHVHPEKSATKPFYRAAEGFNEDPKVADWTIDGITEIDADERVFSVIAHDASLIPILEYFPKTMNEWQSKGWQKRGHWRFLGDFVKGIEEAAKKSDGKL